MYITLQENISHILTLDISNERKSILQNLVDYIKNKSSLGEQVSLNFICTHNSRRSHLSQIWMQVAAAYVGFDNIHTYSGGTEATAMYSAIKKTLTSQGFKFAIISDGYNPVYGIRYSEERPPVIAFSKKFDDTFNPDSSFAAVMTCNHADQNCPVVSGTDLRIPVTYIDPKVSDGTDRQAKVYKERSEQIASEMLYVMKTVKMLLGKKENSPSV